jgi:26S proteasome regulatory subunit N11
MFPVNKYNNPMATLARKGVGLVEPRETTSNVGVLLDLKATIQQRVHRLNTEYYSLVVDFRKTEAEEQMLLNLFKKGWASELGLTAFEWFQEKTDKEVQGLEKFSEQYVEEVCL